MAWETRKRGGKYYYRSSRVNGKVVKTYHGQGPAAEQAAKEDAAAKQLRAMAREELRKFDQDTGPFVDFIKQCDVLVEATLLVAGNYKHKGQWRRRRNHVQKKQS